MGTSAGRESFETQRNNGTSQEKQGSWRIMQFATRQHNQISFAEQGRSVFKCACVKDDAFTLIEIYAANAAKCEPRMALQRESTSTDARY
jgi:hypothetical protein